MKNRQTERYVTAAIVIGGMIGTYFFSRPRKSVAKTIFGWKRKKKIDKNLMTPANETFGIVWPVIYTGTAALAIHQALPSQLDNPRYEKAQPWLRLSYILGSVFGYFFSKSDKKSRVGAAVTTISMLPVALGLHRQLEIGETEVTGPEHVLRKFISIYAGWLAAASAVSITTLAQEAGYAVKTEEAKKWAIKALPITGGLGLLSSRILNDPYFLLSLIAAFAGIAVKQKDTHKELSYEAGGIALTLSGFFAERILKQGNRIES